MRRTRSRSWALAAVAVIALGLLASCASDSDGASESADITTPTSTSAPAAVKPTIVLVHGAFADTSSWAPVAERLRDEGFEVVVPDNPLRGPTADTAALKATLEGIDGDVVVVAHSYGGIPATTAAADDPAVKALVYVTAYVPDEGETLSEIQQRVPGQLTTDRLVIAPYTSDDGYSGVGATIDPSAFGEVFAADLPADEAASLAGIQHPLDLEALNQPSGPPAWRDVPSWYLVATSDQVIPAELARSMASIAGSTVQEIDASHAVLLSQPDAVAELIARVAEQSGS